MYLFHLDEFEKFANFSGIGPFLPVSEIDTLNGLTPIEQVEARVLKSSKGEIALPKLYQCKFSQTFKEQITSILNNLLKKI